MQELELFGYNVHHTSSLTKFGHATGYGQNAENIPRSLWQRLGPTAGQVSLLLSLIHI